MDTIRTLPANPALEGSTALSGDIVFSRPEGVELTLRLAAPRRCAANDSLRYPLILFIQGSAWTSPDINPQLPLLASFANRGFVCAAVTHRNCTRGFPFPAFLQDVKCALRFLRANADAFQIDPARAAAFGTSSGANAALLMGLTGDMPRYKTEEYAQQSDAVCAVVECFGPTDLPSLMDFHNTSGMFPELFTHLLGDDPASERAQLKARAMSPLALVEEGLPCPPTLILHGDRDAIVPYEQGEALFHSLRKKGQDAAMIRVEGADHEGDFWSPAVHEAILDFLTAHLKP